MATIYWAYDSSTATLTLSNSQVSGTDSGSFLSTDHWTSQYSVPWYSYRRDITIVNIASVIQPQYTSYWFYNLAYVTRINNIGNINTSNVLDMNSMFTYCSALTSLDVSGFNTSNVTDMHGVFNGCSSLTSLDVSGFNTSNVTDMSVMFGSCSSLTSLDVSNFDTSNVTNMSSMFTYCTLLTSLDLGSFDTSNVTTMVSMFNSSSGLTSLDLSSFDTSNVAGMSSMFYDCASLTSLDLSGFNTSNITRMNNMFNGCSALVTIYANSDWNVNTPTSTNMFADCISLVGAIAYDSSKTDGAYANPITGYFTALVTTYTVTFDVQGHGTAPSPITGITSGSTISAPTAPTATGYIFEGWYKEAECTNAWNFSTDTVTENKTLYAKWTEVCTVSFDLQGHGSAVASQTVTKGETATLPSPAPSESGYTFWGWYEEAECTNLFDFTTPITADKTLYAKWTVFVQTYTVSFNMNGHGTQIQSQTVAEGGTASRPSDPSETGYTFDGWYADSALTSVFDFSQAINEDKTIHAKWTAIPQYTVSFVMNGHGKRIASQTVYSGQTATRPADPEAEGYEFKGWYDVTLTTAFDFTTPITANTNIYAKWYEIPVLDWNGNRKGEDYIFKRVEWPNFQEHEEYDYITSGSIELSTDADLKVTGSFEFEGYELPDVNDLVRVYYSFTDGQGLTAYEPLATLFVNYASLDYEDTLKGIKASGTLEGSSVLKILQDKITGIPYTVKKNANAVYEADNLIKAAGLQTNLEAGSFVLTSDHTFDSGTDYLEMVNWLLETAGYAQAYPDGNGTVQLVSTDTIQKQEVQQVFKNDEDSIMYPEVEEANDWQETPNVVRLLYNTDDACVVAEATNVTGSRASLDARGNREKTYYEEVSDIGDGSAVTLLKALAESTLKEQSCDVEYVTMSHAYVPVTIHDLVEIKYSEMSWSGLADNISIDLSPATKTQTKIKRTLYEDITVTSSATVYRS